MAGDEPPKEDTVTVSSDVVHHDFDRLTGPHCLRSAENDRPALHVDVCVWDIMSHAENRLHSLPFNNLGNTFESTAVLAENLLQGMQLRGLGKEQDCGELYGRVLRPSSDEDGVTSGKRLAGQTRWHGA